MNTPVPSNIRRRPALYGEGCEGINRRWLLGALASVAVAGPALAHGRLNRTLTWDGTAETNVGGRTLKLIATTQIALPLLRVRSVSRIVGEPVEKSRTLILEPDGAWVEVAGARKPLPPRIGIHERQQYAIYALLYYAQFRPRVRSGMLALNEPPYPPIRFTTGPDGYPIAADVTVEAPEFGKEPVAEQLTFGGRLSSRGVRWPSRIDIAQHGKPYFSLTINRFEAL